MATSGTISTTAFNANRVVDHAFRRCRIPAQKITAEMQSYALDALYLFLSSLGNARTPSWCIEKLLVPMYAGQPVVSLPLGTVGVLNLNYRILQPLTGAETVTATSYEVEFSSSTVVSSVGVKWSATSPAITIEGSDDGVSWHAMGSISAGYASGVWSWVDLTPAAPYTRVRLGAATPISYSQVILGNLPQEIPMGLLNRDGYVAQSNKVFQSRPTNYWFQRDRLNPVLNLWPAPNADAERAQLVVWRHRHIMDTASLRQDVEVPQVWLDAIVANLAAKVAQETPEVDVTLVPLLLQQAAAALADAWSGDGDGSSTFIQPSIRGYTR